MRLPALQLLLYPATDYVNTSHSRTVFADGFLLTERDLNWFRRNYLDGVDVELSDPRVSRCWRMICQACRRRSW